jgi:hypothetical protein
MSDIDYSLRNVDQLNKTEQLIQTDYDARA